MKSYTVLSRQPKVGDDVLVHDEIVRVTGLETDPKTGYIWQVLVERQGEQYSISPFEYSIEVVEMDA